MSETAEKPIVTFDHLLEKYDGNIMLAAKDELEQVAERGLHHLFEACRRHRAKKSAATQGA